MAIPDESPFRPSLEDRRAKLASHFLAAIEPMLEQAPYADLSVERMTKAANVSRTSFYAYFDDKTRLLLEMADVVMSDLLSVAFWQLPDDGNASKDDLRDAVKRLVDVYKEHRLLLRSVAEGAGYDASLRTAYDAVVATGIERLEAHIKQGQANGAIAPHLSPHGTARVVVYMIERSLYQVIGLEGEVSDQDLLDPLTEVVWRALYEGFSQHLND